MKMFSLKGLMLVILSLMIQLSYGQMKSLILNGSFSSDQRLRSNDGNWSWNENRLELNIQSKMQKDLRFNSKLWIRNFGFPSDLNSTSLSNKTLINPIDIEIRTAYVDLYGFLNKNLDLRIGRQYFGWNKADKISPANVLNPLDLEDIWDYGRLSGSDAVKLTYYLKSIQLEGIWMPFFRPAVLPYGEWAQILRPNVEVPLGMELNEFTDSIMLPARSLGKSSSIGLRVSGMLKSVDWSFAYANGFDPLPISKTNIISLGGFSSIDIRSNLGYFRQHSFVGSLSGDIKSIGYWLDAVLIKPTDSVKMLTDLSAFGLPEMDSLLYDTKPYLRLIAGIDYTFSDASYLNIQYLYGFFHERSKEQKDYLFLNYSRDIFKGKINLELIQGAFVIGDRNDIKNNYAIIYTPTVSLIPSDNIKLSLGYRLIEGKGDHLFSMVSDKDEVFVKVKCYL